MLFIDHVSRTLFLHFQIIIAEIVIVVDILATFYFVFNY